LISEEYLRWLGGFFDGEGSVSLSYSANGRTTGKRTFRLQAAVGQKNKEPLDELVSLFGGRIHVNSSGCRQWLVQCAAAGEFLETIYPYVRLKRSVVQLGLLYRAFVENRGGRGRGYGKYQSLLLAIRNEIMRINALD